MMVARAEDRLFVGRAASLWRFAANHPILSVIIITLGQNGLTLWARDLWWADEVRHAGVLLQILDGGDWLALNLNGEFYPDKPPAYFLFLTALMRLLSSREQWVIFLGLALTVFCFFLATIYLAQRLLGDRKMALLALVIVATGSYLLVLSHYARMDFLFTAFICASWACFFDGISKDRANRSIMIGFFWSALAIMTKGPLGFAFPVLGLIGYLWWANRLAMMIRLDFMIGLLLAAVVTAVWAGGVAHVAGADFLLDLLRGQIVERGLRSNYGVLEHARYFITLPLVFLPWTLVFVCGWQRSGAKGAQKPRPRRVLQNGVFFATGCLIVGFGLVSAIGEKHEYYLLPLLVLLGIVAADRFCRLSVAQRKRFWLWTALYFIAIGSVLAVGGSLPDIRTLLADKYDVDLRGAATTGGLSIVLGVSLWMLRLRTQPVLLLVMLAGQSIWINLLVLQVMASLNPIWSTDPVAQLARPYVAQGYKVGIKHGIRGVFAYHLGASYEELGDTDGMRIWREENPKSVLLMPKQRWNRMGDQLPDLRVSGCASVAGLEMVLLTENGENASAADRSHDCK